MIKFRFEMNSVLNCSDESMSLMLAVTLHSDHQRPIYLSCLQSRNCNPFENSKVSMDLQYSLAKRLFRLVLVSFLVCGQQLGYTEYTEYTGDNSNEFNALLHNTPPEEDLVMTILSPLPGTLIPSRASALDNGLVATCIELHLAYPG